ncbi:hypothetical protein GMD78_05980 [Ornithinibacillus sp. L9]|uniref:Peptide ABC transporter permease n=1 Tax=Ornithinibacillus caprae TaxID=2678566 RepID=A0A6N8FGX4_9BACI|nr:hypothetical protein [Ornithinibacillus caprae]MUK87946.1 hypothetical protein [Ornithinibacillus caprae]
MLHLTNLYDKINQNVNSYWISFELVAIALYDAEGIYLYNHPKFLTQSSKPYYYLKRNEQFNGADTLILYEDYPTAIVNLDHYSDMESIYSIVIHELFHGFQHLQGEKRFPNEMLGMTYPLINENVELRNRERSCLYNAVISSSEEDKVSNLKRFICLRENRRGFIDQFLDYELSIETVEGPAYYVELHAYTHISTYTYDDVLRKYSKSLIDRRESSKLLRKSCYSSGLFICLLLDEVSPNWKETFFDSDKPLYDILKEEVEWDYDEIDDVEISTETLSIINSIKKDKSDIFNQFEHKQGHHLFILGDIISKGFDPMNVIVERNKQLHKKFLTVHMNNKEYHIRQPVIAHYHEKFNVINKLHLVLDKKPIMRNAFIYIEGMGYIQGDLLEDEGAFYITL